MLVLEAYILIGDRNVDSAPYSTSLTTFIIGEARVRSRQSVIDQAVSKKQILNAQASIVRCKWLGFRNQSQLGNNKSKVYHDKPIIKS